ncbi:MAG: glutathione S-transferase family protein [Deltaproteobacteria bacterium]|nr:MAG: glutathione S-transferase family protein [Deltaproteobacteria bacterium]
MGMLVDGTWHPVWYDTERTGGRFVRDVSRFRNWIVPEGTPAPSGRAFPPAKGRYHLYVSHACPWAHRTLVFRRLKGLEEHIGVSVVHPFMGEHGWTFEPGDGVVPDPEFGVRYLYELYLRADPHYTGRVTVPVLWDRETKTIVSNESADIIRMMNSSFDGVGARPGDYYPPDLRSEIDRWNERIYETVNDGVYRAGFATRQQAYEEACRALFDTLDALEQHLGHHRFLAGERFTEADVRLWTTLVRFDAVYVTHFKCNVRRIVDHPNLWGYTREIFQVPAIRSTVRFDHIKEHYFRSHETINPTRIVPLGPEINWDAPHDRSALPGRLPALD